MNRENYPASLFPLRGDISAEAGDVTVRVIGIQGVPIDTPISPTDDGNVATYIDADGRIEWKSGNRSAVQINGVGVSTDKQFFINGVTDGSAPTWVVKINGTSDGG